MDYFYTSTNGTPETRASYLFKSEASAKACAEKQNAKAAELGIKARYIVKLGGFPGADMAQVRD